MSYAKTASDITPNCDAYYDLLAACLHCDIPYNERRASMKQARIDASYSLDAPDEIPAGGCFQMDYLGDDDFDAGQITWSRA